MFYCHSYLGKIPKFDEYVSKMLKQKRFGLLGCHFMTPEIPKTSWAQPPICAGAAGHRLPLQPQGARENGVPLGSQELASHNLLGVIFGKVASGYIGDELLPSYIGIIISHDKELYSTTRIQWKVRPVLKKIKCSLRLGIPQQIKALSSDD